MLVLHYLDIRGVASFIMGLGGDGFGWRRGLGGDGFGWRRHFRHVAEFAQVVSVALNGAVIAKQRTEFATGTTQIIVVHQHVVASQRHDDVNFGVVRVFRGPMEQVLVQLQEFGPLVASAGE